MAAYRGSGTHQSGKKIQIIANSIHSHLPIKLVVLILQYIIHFEADFTKKHRFSFRMITVRSTVLLRTDDMIEYQNDNSITFSNQIQPPQKVLIKFEVVGTKSTARR